MLQFAITTFATLLILGGENSLEEFVLHFPGQHCERYCLLRQSFHFVAGNVSTNLCWMNDSISSS